MRSFSTAPATYATSRRAKSPRPSSTRAQPIPPALDISQALLLQQVGVLPINRQVVLWGVRGPDKLFHVQSIGHAARRRASAVKTTIRELTAPELDDSQPFEIHRSMQGQAFSYRVLRR